MLEYRDIEPFRKEMIVNIILCLAVICIGIICMVFKEDGNMIGKAVIGFGGHVEHLITDNDLYYMDDLGLTRLFVYGGFKSFIVMCPCVVYLLFYFIRLYTYPSHILRYPYQHYDWGGSIINRHKGLRIAQCLLTIALNACIIILLIKYFFVSMLYGVIFFSACFEPLNTVIVNFTGAELALVVPYIVCRTIMILYSWICSQVPKLMVWLRELRAWQRKRIRLNVTLLSSITLISILFFIIHSQGNGLGAVVVGKEVTASAKVMRVIACATAVLNIGFVNLCFYRNIFPEVFNRFKKRLLKGRGHSETVIWAKAALGLLYSIIGLVLVDIMIPKGERLLYAITDSYGMLCGTGTAFILVWSLFCYLFTILYLGIKSIRHVVKFAKQEYT